MLDLLSLLPYYCALLLAAIVIMRIRAGEFWSLRNIALIKVISLLFIFDALYPMLQGTLQILIFTAGPHPILQFYASVNSQGMRELILSLTLFVFSKVINEARQIDLESQLFV